MSLQIARAIRDIRSLVKVARQAGKTVALVPTMGSLHEGHLSLVRLAKEQADIVCVSLFVNPKQFGPNEDFATYPREEENDIARLKGVKADLLFAPEADEMYPEGAMTSVEVGPLGSLLEGECRPGFFTGVATVVTKLLLQILPDIAVFGEKDYQQLMVIRRIVQDLDIPVQILGGATVRERDGLALSSRNAYLSFEERKAAPFLYELMLEIAETFRRGDLELGQKLLKGAPQRLSEAGFGRTDYFDLRSAETLYENPDAREKTRLLAAVWLGETRLIDNIAV